jgi:hypothetical protein
VTHGFIHFEVSVALNHDVDELLVGVIAEIKESVGPRRLTETLAGEQAALSRSSSKRSAQKETTEETFGAAIRRFSQRKKKQMAPRSTRKYDDKEPTTKCGNLTPAGLVDRFRQWRRRGSHSCDDVRF